MNNGPPAVEFHVPSVKQVTRGLESHWFILYWGFEPVSGSAVYRTFQWFGVDDFGFVHVRQDSKGSLTIERPQIAVNCAPGQMDCFCNTTTSGEQRKVGSFSFQLESHTAKPICMTNFSSQAFFPHPSASSINASTPSLISMATTSVLQNMFPKKVENCVFVADTLCELLLTSRPWMLLTCTQEASRIDPMHVCVNA